MKYVLMLKFTTTLTGEFPDEDALYRLGDKLASEIVPPEGADLWYVGSEILLKSQP